MSKPIRVWFRKHSTAIYISHLDLNRCMARIVRRAKLPVWYTEGFNPHPYLTFPLPLSLGSEGACEPMDLRLEEDIPLSEVAARLRACAPDGIEFLYAALPVMKAGAVASARYSMWLEAEGLTGEEIRGLVEAALSADSLPATKRTKSGFKEMDVKPFLRCEAVEAEENACRVTTVLPCGSSVSINPALVASALSAQSGCTLTISRTVREQILNEQNEPFA